MTWNWMSVWKTRRHWLRRGMYTCSSNCIRIGPLPSKFAPITAISSASRNKQGRHSQEKGLQAEPLFILARLKAGGLSFIQISERKCPSLSVELNSKRRVRARDQTNSSAVRLSLCATCRHWFETPQERPYAL